MNIEKILFGAAYYDEYMPCERLEEDVRMMQQAGINTVRIAESTWSTLEPREGEFDFTHIDRVLDAMEEAGISVIIGTPTYAVPSWLARKDDDILAEGKNGRAVYGARQNMNIVNPTYRRYAERVIRSLMEHVADRRCVIGYQIDNETKHYGTAGPYVQKLFKNYLMEKFDTVERMNQEFGFAYWSNSLGSWDDLPDVRGTINASYACEFEKFQRKLASDFLHWQAAIVREYKRADQFITQNFDFEWKKFGADAVPEGYSYGVQPDINHFEASQCLTVAGTDIYHMTQDDLTGAEIAFGGDEIRSLKQDNYLVLETEAQAFKFWLPYDGQLRLQAYSHIASGAAGVMYWHWHSIHNSFETYWKGLLSHDLEPNPTYEEAAVIGREFREHASDLIHLKKKNQAAVLISNESLTALKWFPIDQNLSYNDVVRWVYDSMYELNLECDVIFTEDPVDYSRYKLIVTPALYCASEQTIKRLKDYVARGGVLLSTFRSFVCNEHVKVYHDAQPHMLTECFGMSYNQFTMPRNVLVDGKAADYWMELLNPRSAETLAFYEHKYWGKYAAVTKNSYGRGTAFYVGCYVEKELLKKYILKAAEAAGLELPAVQWPVILRSCQQPSGKSIHFLLNYSDCDKEIICMYDAAVDLLTGAEYNKGETIRLGDWGVVILKH